MSVILPTPDEAEKIRAGDNALRAKYYLLNYDQIKRYAVGFCRRIRDFSECDDYAHEVCVEFEKISFENERFFGHDCFKVFCRYHYGDQRKREQLKDGKIAREEYTLDALVKGLEKEGDTVGDTIASDIDVHEQAFPRPDISQSLYDFLCENLAREQKRVFELLYWTGDTHNEIAEKLGKSPKTVKRTREEIFKKFRKRKDELTTFLTEIGYY